MNYIIKIGLAVLHTFLKKRPLYLSFFIGVTLYAQHKTVSLGVNFPTLVNATTLKRIPVGGDTIFISALRTKALKFQHINGNAKHPIVVINQGGQVKIDDSSSWGAITFENCTHIKISGAGHPNYKYGFKLSANDCGLAFSGLSSDCEAELIKISHNGFFGIFAKKDFGSHPPSPPPVFKNLIIHDCFVENVSEGMYLGETKTPGMEFKGVKVYNNIVRNTGRESIQIANMVEHIEIFNNTLINAGLDQIKYHTNNLQIGDNSEVRAFNNIIIGAPAFGIIALGKGNSSFINNYLASNLGMFIDNRTVSDSLTTIRIEKNYFTNSTGAEIIKNRNEINNLILVNNVFDTNIPFFINESGSSNNYSLHNNVFKIKSHHIQFNDTSSNDYSLAEGTPVEFFNMGAPGGAEFFDRIPETSQIRILPEMVKDAVEGGSLKSPLLLFDEQHIDPLVNEHPIGHSWKPNYTMDKASYHAIVDLGKAYYISDIYIHDMHDNNPMTVEFKNEMSDWSRLFIAPCTSFKTWSFHATNKTTRYLRFSMNEGVNAAVNEIIIYGYASPEVLDSRE